MPRFPRAKNGKARKIKMSEGKLTKEEKVRLHALAQTDPMQFLLVRQCKKKKVWTKYQEPKPKPKRRSKTWTEQEYRLGAAFAMILEGTDASWDAETVKDPKAKILTRHELKKATDTIDKSRQAYLDIVAGEQKAPEVTCPHENSEMSLDEFMKMTLKKIKKEQDNGQEGE